MQLQWCGASGKKDNCIVTVHLAYAADNFHCLLDSELFLPESWSNDRPRCREAYIPDDMVHRTKPQIALELYDRAKSNGVVFEWLTFDELYGHNREFLTGLRQRQQKYVAEVPVTFSGWVQSPRVTHRTYRRCAYRGRVRKTPRCVQETPPPESVREHLQASPELRDQPWQKFRIKDGEKGPQVWEAKHRWFYPQDGHGLPQEPVHLIVARSVFEPEQIKYFIAHAPRETSLKVLLCVAFTRWRVERCFEDQKTELDFDHFEGRSYVGLMRHQIITALTHLFLSRVHLQWREKNPLLTVCQVRTATSALIQSWFLTKRAAPRLLQRVAKTITDNRCTTRGLSPVPDSQEKGMILDFLLTDFTLILGACRRLGRATSSLETLSPGSP